MSKDTSITFRVGSPLKKALSRLAEEDGRTLSNYIKRVLEDHVAANGTPAELSHIGEEMLPTTEKECLAQKAPRTGRGGQPT